MPSARSVSVIIPAFRAADSLRAAVASALTQERVAVEVIIVDDASDDDTSDVADDLGRDARIVVVHRPITGGPSVARNDGLRRARLDWVVFLDADDELTSGALATLTSCVGPHDVAAAGRFIAVDEKGREVDIGTWASEQLRPVVRRGRVFIPDSLSAEAILTRLVTPPPGGVLVRRSTALEIGGFDTRARRSEDIDFLVRLASAGTIAVCDGTVLRYRRRASQRSAHTRRRQLGRLRTLVALIARAPTRSAARARARGVRSHHIDRARTRWRFGDRSARDAASALRSYALSALFGTLGALAVWRAPRDRSTTGW